MRSLNIAIFSSLLLSPISVLATYHHDTEHAQYPQHVNEYDHSHKDDHREFKHSEHRVIKTGDHSTKKVVRIIIDVDVKEKEVENICGSKEESCLHRHECNDEKKSCPKKTKCQERKKKCLEEYKCHKPSKTCHPETTKSYGFRCGKKFYNHAKVISAAKAACPHMDDEEHHGSFPHSHNVYGFGVRGPYAEWPITLSGKHFSKEIDSKRRILINKDCEVFGAVYEHEDGAYSKCKYESE